MRRVIGIDIHRTFGEVVIWEDGRLRHAGRVDMTRTALEGFGKELLATDEVVIEATGNCMAVSRVLSPFVARVVIANPLQVKAIAHAHVKTDKVDAGTLASLHAAGYLPEIWTPDAATERMRRLVARRYQVVRHRTRIKNEVHSILHAHLIPQCPHADLFGARGRAWLARQPCRTTSGRPSNGIVANSTGWRRTWPSSTARSRRARIDDAAVKRLMTITGVNLTVAAGLVAAIGDIGRFKSPQKLVSYFGLNPRVRQSGLGAAHHGRISKVGRSHARAMLVEAAWAAAKAPGPLHAFFVRIRAQARPSDRRGRRGPQAHRAVLASADQGQTIISGRARRWSPTRRAPWNCRPGSRRRRATGAGRPMPTTSRRCATRRCASPSRPSKPTSTSSRMETATAQEAGARAPQTGKARMRRPGGACSRRAALRHEVARARPNISRGEMELTFRTVSDDVAIAAPEMIARCAASPSSPRLRRAANAASELDRAARPSGRATVPQMPGERRFAAARSTPLVGTRSSQITSPAQICLSISSVECSLARCSLGKVM